MMKATPPSVETLIRKHSKARVIVAAPVDPRAAMLGLPRQMTDGDVLQSMVRKYAK